MREINLLPPKRRRLLESESVFNSLTTFLNSLVLVAAFLTSTGVILVVLLSLLSFASARTTQAELSQMVLDYQGLRDQIAQNNVLLEQIAGVGRRRIVWGEELQTLLEVVPPGVTLNQVTAQTQTERGEVLAAQLMLSGQAVTRSTLAIFEARLEALPNVLRVESPTSNLLERNNPLFEMTLLLREGTGEGGGVGGL